MLRPLRSRMLLPGTVPRCAPCAAAGRGRALRHYRSPVRCSTLRPGQPHATHLRGPRLRLSAAACRTLSRPHAAPLRRPRVPPELSPTQHSLPSCCAGAQLQATQPHAAPLRGPTLRPCAVTWSPPARSPSASQRNHTLRPRGSQCAPAEHHMLRPCSVTRCALAPARPHAAPEESPTRRRCAAVAPLHNPKQHPCVAALHRDPARCPAAPMHVPTLSLPPPSQEKHHHHTKAEPPPPRPQHKHFTTSDSPRWRRLCCHSLPASAYPEGDRVNRPVGGWGLQFSGGPPLALPSPQAGRPETRNQKRAQWGRRGAAVPLAVLRLPAGRGGRGRGRGCGRGGIPVVPPRSPGAALRRLGEGCLVVPAPGGQPLTGGGDTPLLPPSTLRALGRRAGPRPRTPPPVAAAASARGASGWGGGGRRVLGVAVRVSG